MFSPVSKPILASTHVATPFRDLQDVHILVSVCKLKAFAIVDKLFDEILAGCLSEVANYNDELLSIVYRSCQTSGIAILSSKCDKT